MRVSIGSGSRHERSLQMSLAKNHPLSQSVIRRASVPQRILPEKRAKSIDEYWWKKSTGYLAAPSYKPAWNSKRPASYCSTFWPRSAASPLQTAYWARRRRYNRGPLVLLLVSFFCTHKYPPSIDLLCPQVVVVDRVYFAFLCHKQCHHCSWSHQPPYCPPLLLAFPPWLYGGHAAAHQAIRLCCGRYHEWYNRQGRRGRPPHDYHCQRSGRREQIGIKSTTLLR